MMGMVYCQVVPLMPSAPKRAPVNHHSRSRSSKVIDEGGGGELRSTLESTDDLRKDGQTSVLDRCRREGPGGSGVRNETKRKTKRKAKRNKGDVARGLEVGAHRSWHRRRYRGAWAQ